MEIVFIPLYFYEWCFSQIIIYISTFFSSGDEQIKNILQAEVISKL